MSFFHKFINNIKSMMSKGEDETVSRTRYVILNKLHSAKYSKVYHCKLRENNKELCLKIYSAKQSRHSAELEDQVLNEINILRKVNHPCLLGCFNVFLTQQKAILEMDFMHGGDLYDFLTEHGMVKEPSIKIIARRLLSAVKYLHEVNIIHRDIKLENILLETNNDISSIKLSDFGLSIELQNEMLLTEQVGTSYYMAPELYRKTPYGNKIDCWSCGVVLYALLFGSFPFPGENQELIKNILRGKFSFPTTNGISEECQDFINGLLKKNVTERLSSIKAIQHDFLEGKEIRGSELRVEEDTIRNRNSESLISHLTTTNDTTNTFDYDSDDFDDDDVF